MITLQNTKLKIENWKRPASVLFALLSPRLINALNMDYLIVIRAFDMEIEHFFRVMSLSELYIFRRFTEIVLHISINFTEEISI